MDLTKAAAPGRVLVMAGAAGEMAQPPSDEQGGGWLPALQAFGGQLKPQAHRPGGQDVPPRTTRATGAAARGRRKVTRGRH